MGFLLIKQEMKFSIDLSIAIFIRQLSIKKILFGITIQIHKI